MEKNKRYKIICVDDHPGHRQGVREMVEENWPGCQYFEASSKTEGELIRNENPNTNIMIVDVDIDPGPGETQATGWYGLPLIEDTVKKHFPIHVVAYTKFDTPSIVQILATLNVTVIKKYQRSTVGLEKLKDYISAWLAKITC